MKVMTKASKMVSWFTPEIHFLNYKVELQVQTPATILANSFVWLMGLQTESTRELDPKSHQLCHLLMQVPNTFRVITCSNAIAILCIGSIRLPWKWNHWGPGWLGWILRVVLGFHPVFWIQSEGTLSTLAPLNSAL